MTDARTFAHPLSRDESERLRRLMTTSLAVHVGVVLVLFLVPRSWLNREPVRPPMMTISLGAMGPRTTGLNPAGARPVEQVAPPPVRPETARTATPKNEPPMASVRTAKTPPKPAPAESPTAPVTTTRPPITGAQVTPGTARAETGAIGQGTGLAGGAGAGAVTPDVAPNFCCPDYVTEMQRRIMERWKNVQSERGTTILTFTVRRDGTFTAPDVVQSAGVFLDFVSKSALRGLVLPPLPAEYKEETLKVRLTFPYVR